MKKIKWQKTKKILKRQSVYKYIDFLSDDEDFYCSSSSSWRGSSDSLNGLSENAKNNADKNKKEQKL